MIVLLSVILFSIIVSASIVIISEIRNRDTSGIFYPRIWCFKHGLRFCDGVMGNGIGIVDATVWWGENANGDKFIPDANGIPVILEMKGGAK